MIRTEKELYDFIERVLKPHGYIRKKGIFYLNTLECICFFQVSKLKPENAYQNLMGCILKETGDQNKLFPNGFNRNLEYLLDEFTDKQFIRKVFDLEWQEFSGNHREIIIKDLIEGYVIPFLQAVSTKEGIREAYGKYEKLRFTMDTGLKTLLDLPI